MSGSPWYRFALSILLAFSVVALWMSRFDELSYHSFGPAELKEIGDATSFSDKASEFKPNDYVSVSGVLGNKAATLRGLRAGSFRFGRYQVRQLLGSNVYIEYPEEKYHPTFNPYTRVTVQGRLTQFGPGSELEKVREFFANHYKKPIDDRAVLVVVDEEPRSSPIYLVFFALSVTVVAVSFYFSMRGFRRHDP